MGLSDSMNKISKLRLGLQNDNSGLAPILWALFIAGSLIVGIGVYQVTQRPDVTYNITDTGFSLAGVDVSFFAVIGVVIVILFMVVLWARSQKPKQ